MSSHPRRDRLGLIAHTGSAWCCSVPQLLCRSFCAPAHRLGRGAHRHGPAAGARPSEARPSARGGNPAGAPGRRSFGFAGHQTRSRRPAARCLQRDRVPCPCWTAGQAHYQQHRHHEPQHQFACRRGEHHRQAWHARLHTPGHQAGPILLVLHISMRSMVDAAPRVHARVHHRNLTSTRCSVRESNCASRGRCPPDDRQCLTGLRPGPPRRALKLDPSFTASTAKDPSDACYCPWNHRALWPKR